MFFPLVGHLNGGLVEGTLGALWGESLLDFGVFVGSFLILRVFGDNSPFHVFREKRNL